MSLEAIQKVTAAEQATREQKARAQAEEVVKAMLAEAEERAGKRTEQALADNAAQCEALKQAARGRLDRAAGLIVGRVGTG